MLNSHFEYIAQDAAGTQAGAAADTKAATKSDSPLGTPRLREDGSGSVGRLHFGQGTFVTHTNKRRSVQASAEHLKITVTPVGSQALPGPSSTQPGTGVSGLTPLPDEDVFHTTEHYYADHDEYAPPTPDYAAISRSIGRRGTQAHLDTIPPASPAGNDISPISPLPGLDAGESDHMPDLSLDDQQLIGLHSTSIPSLCAQRSVSSGYSMGSKLAQHSVSSNPNSTRRLDESDSTLSALSCLSLHHPTRRPADEPSLSTSKVTWKERAKFGAVVGAGVGVGAGTILAFTAQGSLLGTAIGTAFPGIGNAVGAVVGALGGAVWGTLVVAGVVGATTGAATATVAPPTKRAAGNAISRGFNAVRDRFCRLKSSINARFEARREQARKTDEIRKIKWSQPVELRKVRGDDKFHARVEALLNETAKTEEQYLASLKRKPARPPFEGHVFETFAADMGRTNISVGRGKITLFASEVLANQIGKNGPKANSRRPSLRPTWNAPELPSLLRQDSLNHSRINDTNSAAKNEMLQDLIYLPRLLGGVDEDGQIAGQRATEIVTSVVHQGIFASVSSLLATPSGEVDASGCVASNPFHCGVGPGYKPQTDDEKALQLTRAEAEVARLAIDLESDWDDLQAARERLEFLRQQIPSFHIQVTDQPGVFRFSARLSQRLEGMTIVRQGGRGGTFKTDPAQSFYKCSICGIIDTNKETNFVTLDADSPEFSLVVYPKRWVEAQAAAKAQAAVEQAAVTEASAESLAEAIAESRATGAAESLAERLVEARIEDMGVENAAPQT